MTNAPVPAPDSTAGWKRALAIAVMAVIMGMALHALAGEFGHGGYHQIVHAVRALSHAQLAAATTLGLCSYACLIGFDAIGLRRHGRPISRARVGVTAFLAHAAGQTLGFAALTGGAVRVRSYGAAGLSLLEIAQVVWISTLGFVLGAWVLLAVAFCTEPQAAARALPLTAGGLRYIGVALLLSFAALVWWCGRAGRSLGWGSHRVWLPDRRTLGMVTALSVVELALASAAFYVLLPTQQVGFFGFVGLYLVATLAGLVSTVPAGLGVFEWSLVKLLPQVPAATLLGAAVAYRVTYYLLPLLLATLLALLSGLRRPLSAGANTGWQVVRPWVPRLVATTVFAAGALLIIDGTLPVSRHTVLPALPLVETSHLIGSLGGVVLLLIGQGLQRRNRSAWWVALLLCVALPLPTWLRGGHISVAVLLVLAAVALWAARNEFYREGALLDEAWSWPWLRNVALVLVAALWLLFFVYSHVEYQNELWWQFATSANAPRALRAMLVVCVVVIVFALARLLQASHTPLPLPDGAALAMLQPVLEGAADTQACLVMTGDKALLCDAEHRGFVMLQRYGGSLIAMGDPVGPPEVVHTLIWRFREEADRLGLRPVFYQVGEQFWATYLDMGLSLVKLGEEAMVSLEGFTLEGRPRAELRQAHNRGKRAGLDFHVVPAADVAPLLPQLRVISDQWLDEKAGEEKGFSLGSFDDSYLQRFPLAVVQAEGRLVAFANLWQAPAGKELSIDLMRYLPDAPKGTMDYLFVELFLWGAANGYTRFSLGMAPLTGLPQHRLAGRWSRFANVVMRHGERFYGFEGLRRFKAKFDPQWRPRFLAAPGGIQLPAALLDVTRLISLDPRRRH